MTTHEVLNQAPPLAGYDVYAADTALVEGVAREGAGWADAELRSLGELAGRPESQALGVAANAYPPVLHTHDRYGHRVDEVEFHPAWHSVLSTAVAHGLHASPWRDPRPGAHVARAAAFAVWSQVEAGHGCPIAMTYAAVPALQATPELAAQWVPGLTSLDYDFGLRPAAEKRGLLAGMAMTEKQGGSDVRANTTRAEPGSDGTWRLTGHKWFCSAPMCDVFLVLAQAPRGLSCFVLPRVLPDGTRNAMHLQRLKDKLGNKSNASSEIELVGATAWLLGEEGRGVRTIIEMVNYTRLDCVIGSLAGLRQGVAQATHHAAHRQAFGRYLTDQPLMQNVLADLAVEAEAATVLTLRLAAACDRAPEDARESAFRRLALAVSKYWVCKRFPSHAVEAMECLGGNGYVEDSGMPRLYREAPLPSIWEGSGNVNALDVLRAMGKEPESVAAFFSIVEEAGGAEPRVRTAMDEVQRELADLDGIEVRARRIVERLALLLQGALLVSGGHPAVTEAFLASRLAGDWGQAFGTLPRGLDLVTIVERARPKVG